MAGKARRLVALDVLVKERVTKLAARSLAVLNSAIEVLDLQVLALVGRIDLQELQAGAEHKNAAGAPDAKQMTKRASKGVRIQVEAKGSGEANETR